MEAGSGTNPVADFMTPFESQGFDPSPERYNAKGTMSSTGFPHVRGTFINVVVLEGFPSALDISEKKGKAA